MKINKPILETPSTSVPVYRMSEWKEVFWEKKTDYGYRYYRVLIHQDLFGYWLVTRIWGGTLREAGQFKGHLADSKAEALELLDTIAERRKKRGYQIVQKMPNVTK